MLALIFVDEEQLISIRVIRELKRVVLVEVTEPVQRHDMPDDIPRLLSLGHLYIQVLRCIKEVDPTLQIVRM